MPGDRPRSEFPAPDAAARDFEERPRERLVPDAYRLGAVPLGGAAIACALGWPLVCGAALALTLFVAAFFRNPSRPLPGGERQVVAPADGRVLEAGEVEGADGSKRLRVAIFLSVFDVHVNRMPVAGRVTGIERGGDGYRAAFRADADATNVFCRVDLETAAGELVSVTQITGWIARRILCYPRVGQRIERGMRYGLIRFGSRTDVTLPVGATLRVQRGDRVTGGATVVADLPPREDA